MKKIMFMVVMSGLMFGCASKGDLNALSVRVDELTVKQKALEADHETIKSDHEAIKGELADVNAKFDRAFAKSMKK